MIDWIAVGFNSLWIAGLALILASVSYYYWVATEENQPLRLAVQRPAFVRFIYIGLVLVGIGLIGTSDSIIETVLAVGLVLLCLFGLLRLFQQTRGERT